MSELASESVPEAARAVLDFWFTELKPEAWFKRDDLVDGRIADRFAGQYDELRAEVPESWLATPQGMLAAIIVLDQFPRNMFRDDPQAFATDAKALALSKRAIDAEFDKKLAGQQLSFLYMPFQHSEDAADQARSVELFKAVSETTLDYARRHKAVIDRFGRFPHRNRVLGRTSTPAEAEFLTQPGSSF